ncbi:MAG: SMP-30/gluconolactonase/LRE family protein [Pseudomonadota bacterium]
MKKILLGVLLVLVAYLALWPVPIDPKSWTPPALPDGYAYNEKLKGIQRLAEGFGVGPEAVAVDMNGTAYSGLLDGRVFKVDMAGTVTEIANTGGRPLGLALAPDGAIWVADAKAGLLKIINGKVEVMSTEAEGLKFGFTDDVDIAPDGAVYFTDASSKFGFGQHMEEAFEHGANGRVLKFDPKTGATTVIARDMVFPNGIAVGYGGDYLLVNETLKYRVMRIWLKGANAGKVEPFIENLPGYPDNVTYNGFDTVWVALFSPRMTVIDATLPYPWMRTLTYRLPEFLWPHPPAHSFALGVGLDGKVKYNLQYKGEGVYAPITSVRQSGDSLYFGSLMYPALGKIRLADATSP